MIADPDVDLVYVGTPHSHHYDVTREALLAGKPCLVEKAFMANLREAKEIVELAHQRHVFLAEAIWTRYQPAVGIVRNLISTGRIGTPRMVTATLGYSMGNKERIMRPDLCGGALLDLGVYALNFVRMFFSADIVKMESLCVKSQTGMDLTNAISLVLADGMLCNLQSSAACVGDNIGVIAGTEGNLIIDNINNPQTITVNGPDRTFVETIHVPQQITALQFYSPTALSSTSSRLLSMGCSNRTRCLTMKSSTSCNSWTPYARSGVYAILWIDSWLNSRLSTLTSNL